MSGKSEEDSDAPKSGPTLAFGSWVATLHPGDSCGEAALSGSNNVRSATIFVAEPCVLLTLTREHYVAIIDTIEDDGATGGIQDATVPSSIKETLSKSRFERSGRELEEVVAWVGRLEFVKHLSNELK